MKRTETQVRELGVDVIYDPVKNITKDKLFTINTSSGKEYKAKKVIYTVGTVHRHLNVPGEDDLSGRGVSYCATCDGPFFKDKTVGVVGGSDSALSAAALIAEYAKKVYIIYRKDRFFRAEPTWVDIIKEFKNIEPMFNENVVEIKGDNLLREVKLSSGSDLKLDGLFIEIGSDPMTDTINELNVEKNEGGYIITNPSQETNVKGFFAAGDVTNNLLKQAITAASEGATSAYAAYNEIIREE